MYQTKVNQRKREVATSVSGKVNFKLKKIIRAREGPFKSKRRHSILKMSPLNNKAMLRE
jgi:hypothetical protein